jgi:hypothetical protein
MRPTRLTTKFQLTAAVFGLALGAAIMAVSAPARAADGDAEGDSEAFDSKILRSILEGIGLRRDGPNINYQERAPLVIPPRLDLPPVETNSAAANNPAWPKDPDVQRAKEEAARERAKTRWAGDRQRDEERVLRPDELAAGRTNRPSRDDGYRTSAHGYGSQESPSMLGYTGNIFSKFFGKDEEVAQFTNEPPRAQLTDPPPGYRTPSPAQPYGLGKPSAPPAAKAADYAKDHVTPK